ERLDPKAVLAVDDARDEQAPEPAQLAVRLDGLDGGLERRRSRSRRLDPHLQPRAYALLTADLADEWIPLRVGGEVGQDRPHPFRRSVNLDLVAELSHVGPVLQRTQRGWRAGLLV